MSKEEFFTALDTLFSTFSRDDEAIGEASWSGVSTAKYDTALKERTRDYYYNLTEYDQQLLISLYIRDRYLSDEALAKGHRYFHIDMFTYWITHEL